MMRLQMIRLLVAITAVLFAVSFGIEPSAAADWPTHPLTMVVPWAAGGGTDVMGRIMARRMSEILGQPVIVENIPGGGGMVGSAHVVRADPDGYTFVFGSRSDAIDMTLYKHPSYSLKDDLTPVVLVADQPTILVARKDFPVDGLKNFVAYLKQNAATMKMGSAGIGATGTIDCAIFNNMIGVNVQPIPYRGSGPAMEDLIARQFDYFCTISGSAVAPLQNDLVKGIAVFTHDRMPSLPKLPTTYEQGMNIEGSTWFGFFAPKGTPPEIIKKLHDASVSAMETPEVQEQLAKNGTYVVSPERRSTEYFESIIGPEIEKNGAPLRAAGISVD
jgi:tripartite-type tricarboxylate transporter receptor subunit TctC